MLHSVWGPALHSPIAPIDAHILSPNVGERGPNTKCGNCTKNYGAWLLLRAHTKVIYNLSRSMRIFFTLISMVGCIERLVHSYEDTYIHTTTRSNALSLNAVYMVDLPPRSEGVVKWYFVSWRRSFWPRETSAIENWITASTVLNVAVTNVVFTCKRQQKCAKLQETAIIFDGKKCAQTVPQWLSYQRRVNSLRPSDEYIRQ